MPAPENNYVYITNSRGSHTVSWDQGATSSSDWELETTNDDNVILSYRILNNIEYVGPKQTPRSNLIGKYVIINDICSFFTNEKLFGKILDAYECGGFIYFSIEVKNERIYNTRTTEENIKIVSSENCDNIVIGFPND